MPRVKVISNLDDAIRRYLAGETVGQLAPEFGVSRGTLQSRMLDAGVRIRTHGESASIMNQLRVRKTKFDGTDAIARYQAGETAKSLSAEYGVSDRAFVKELRARGIEPRSQSKALSLRYTRMTATERAAVTEAAHAAIRGRPASPIRLERRAKTMELTLQLAGRSDLLLAVWLAQRNIPFTLQKAIGPYNIDIAIHKPAVAVEVGDAWHTLRISSRNRSTAAERREYLLNRGWHMIEVRIDGAGKTRQFLRESAADRIVTLLKMTREDEAAWGKYCVIWGDGEDAPAFSNDGDHRA